jgi:hypothetical protein
MSTPEMGVVLTSPMSQKVSGRVDCDASRKTTSLTSWFCTRSPTMTLVNMVPPAVPAHRSCTFRPIRPLAPGPPMQCRPAGQSRLVLMSRL